MSVVFSQKKCYTIKDLVEIVSILRSDDGCPWDKEQTHSSMRGDLIEETYELVEAIDLDDKVLMLEELGDVLLHVVLHAQIENEQKGFTFEQVCDTICKKLIHRHPHVFADTTANSIDEVLANWDSIKMQSKGQEFYTQTLNAVPKVFPALMRCQKIQKRASKAEFSGIAQTTEQALNEFKQLGNNIGNCNESSIGKLLFQAVNLARLSGIDCEQALTQYCNEYISDFSEKELN